MPPRAFIEPAIGRSPSILTKRRPSTFAPYFSLSRSFIAGASRSSDSIIPRASAVSGNFFIMNGAKRASRASASSTSAIESGRPPRAVSKLASFGLSQSISRSSASALTVGFSSISLRTCSLSIAAPPVLCRCDEAAALSYNGAARASTRGRRTVSARRRK